MSRVVCDYVSAHVLNYKRLNVGIQEYTYKIQIIDHSTNNYNKTIIMIEAL